MREYVQAVSRMVHYTKCEAVGRTPRQIDRVGYMCDCESREATEQPVSYHL